MFTFVSDQWKNMISCNSRTENCTSCAGLNSFRRSCRQAFILDTSCSKNRRLHWTWMGKLPFVPQCWIWLEWSPTPEDTGGKPDVSDPTEGIIKKQKQKNLQWLVAVLCAFCRLKKKCKTTKERNRQLKIRGNSINSIYQLQKNSQYSFIAFVRLDK